MYHQAPKAPATKPKLTEIPPPPNTFQNRARAFLHSQTAITNPVTSRSLSLSFPPPLAPSSSFQNIPGCELIKPIGKGTYGEVYHVRLQDKEAVLKVFKGGNAMQNKIEYETEQTILREIALHEHANGKKLQISHLMPGIQGDHAPNLVLEYIQGYDLTKLNPIRFRTFASLTEYILSMMKQMEHVLDGLHAMNIYHNDIKPANILCDSEHKLFHLIDFGLAVPLSLLHLSHFRQVKFWTTLPFMSPFHLEIIEKIKMHGSMQNDDNTRQKAKFADFYSLGVTAITILANNCFGNDALCLMAKRIERRQRLFSREDTMGFVHWTVQMTKSKMMPYWRTIQDTVREAYGKKQANENDAELVRLLAKWLLVVRFSSVETY